MLPDLRIPVAYVGSVRVPPVRYQTAGASGIDLHAATTQPITVPPLGRVRVPTGLAIAIPPSFEGQVRPRSGLAERTGLTVLNAPGTIDSDYRGEIAVLLVNLGAASVTIEPMERIAQLVIAPVARAELIAVEELESTARGAGGYGSTGRL